MIWTIDELESNAVSILPSVLHEGNIVLAQYRNAVVSHRDISSVGWFSDFSIIKDCVPLSTKNTMYFGDVVVEIIGMHSGIGIMLYAENGYILQLEAYTFQESIPFRIIQSDALALDVRNLYVPPYAVKSNPPSL